MLLNPDWLYAIAWEFQVKPEFQAQFEQVYGPQGEWAQFFRTATGYVGTELIRDQGSRHRYVTLDLWCSRQDYEAFRRHHAEEYHRIDQRCEQMTEAERALGIFERVAPPG
jgi:heme-degrading monooxygenase HmoA